METKFKNKYNRLANAINEMVVNCLTIITDIVKLYPNATLKFGNTTLKVEDNVVYIATGWDEAKLKFVPLYSTDGYDSPYDIANWADIVTDVHNCYQEGNKEYSVRWNANRYYRVLFYNTKYECDEDYINVGNDFAEAVAEWKEAKENAKPDQAVFLYIMEENGSDEEGYNADAFIDDITYEAEQA